MGSSAKKKREKKQDFQKAKLKVGKARPKNTNATDTSFAAKAIVLKQQSLGASARDSAAQFKHNLSLLSSKSESQRKDALTHLTSAVTHSLASQTPAITTNTTTTTSAVSIPASKNLANPGVAQRLPQPASLILARAQPLLLDGSPAVRSQALKLLRALPPAQLGPLDQLLLYTRAGMTHLSAEIRGSAVEALEWAVGAAGSAVVGAAGGWVRTLLMFQNLLAWHGPGNPGNGSSSKAGAGAVVKNGAWTAAAPSAAAAAAKTGASSGGGSGSGSSGSGGAGSSGKLLIRQLAALAKFLTVGFTRGEPDAGWQARQAADAFPLWGVEAYALPTRANAFAYLNLFGAPREVEGEVYDDPEERIGVFVELGLNLAFALGAREAKREGGEVGRAAAMVEKALKMVGDGGG